MSVALEAHEIVNGQRRIDYGPCVDSFEKIATMWSAYLEVDVTPQDVAMCMALLKICRYSEGGTWDSLVDLAGYADCAGQIDEDERRRKDFHTALKILKSSAYGKDEACV